MSGLSPRALLCLVLLALCACDLSAGTTRQEQLRKQYDDALAKLKDDDDAGYQRLAMWCQQNKLTKEADQTWNLVLKKKREKLAANQAFRRTRR